MLCLEIVNGLMLCNMHTNTHTHNTHTHTHTQTCTNASFCIIQLCVVCMCVYNVAFDLKFNWRSIQQLLQLSEELCSGTT